MKKLKKLKQLKEILEEHIKLSNKVLIVPHTSPDFDALGSAVGLAKICKKFDKKSYILIEENIPEYNKGVKELILKIEEQYNVISLKNYLEIFDSEDLLITTDVNKDYLVEIKDYLNNFKTKIVIDHHFPDDHTIRTKYKYINTDISSASEIVAKLLKCYKIKYDKNCATYLYAGISLDTKRLTQNLSSDTLDIASKLIENGADMNYIKYLFIEDFENDRKIHNLIGNSNFCNYSYVITQGNEEIYTKDDLAKAADYILKYNVDAAFAIGLLDENLIGISGRSNGNINIGKVLGLLGGGGNLMNGATRIESNNIEDVSKKLKLVLTPGQEINFSNSNIK